MDTALRLEQFALGHSYELQVIGIPKTIDNDLMETDHTPGYASAARFFAHAARDIGEDNRSLPSPVCVLEVLGRNAGWIVAATSLARHCEDDAPHLIYFPERPISVDRLLTDVERVYTRIGRVVLAVCEGQLDDRGQPFGADIDRPDTPQHRLASNLGHSLAKLISSRLGIRARSEKPGLLGRSGGPLASEIDRREAYECGVTAVAAARRGESGVMIGLRREPGPTYGCTTFSIPLADVAGKERLFPLDWILPAGTDILPHFSAYAGPLVGPVPAYGRFPAG
jgi:6-phosphofructokinase